MPHYETRRDRTFTVGEQSVTREITEWDNGDGSTHWSLVQEWRPDDNDISDPPDCVKFFKENYFLTIALIENEWEIYSVDGEYVLWTIGHPDHE